MKDGLEINSLGTKRYYKNGVYHREDGPALEFSDGIQLWYQNGNLHREDGPAIVGNLSTRSGGHIYFLFGKAINSLEELQQLVKMKAFW